MKNPTGRYEKKKKKKGHQPASTVTLSDLWYHLQEVMNNQKCGLTSFI